jgi:hypothetical protein
MSNFDSPALIEHVALLRTSYRRWTGKDLLPPGIGEVDAVRALDDAPFAVVSHGTQTDPIFNYGNRLALRLFEMDWEEFTALPSRLSAEPGDRDARQRLLAQVGAQGYSDNYAGVRIAKTGRRFEIGDATLWNLVDAEGGYRGQAALIRRWRPLP